MTELGELEKDRQAVRFIDAGNSACVLQADMHIADTVHIGRSGRAVVTLDRLRVVALITMLQRWLDTGSFKPVERTVVVVDEDAEDMLAELIRAIHTCGGGSIIFVPDVLYALKDIKMSPPTGMCECGAERAADTGRCVDGCDDD